MDKLRRLQQREKGFTMVEVLISMAIISLLAMSFIPLFSSSLVNIFAYGERERAMTAASDIMEHLYARQPFDNGEPDIEELINENNENNKYEDFSFDDEIDKEVIEDVEGYKVTIEVKYQNEERKVTLTSFVRGAH